MKFKSESSTTRGMLFVGCSYTWGQGLYYYSNSSTLVDGELYGYNPRFYKLAHHRFKETVRYPRLVAEHFNTYEIVHPRNGGAVDQMLEYWDSCFKPPEQDAKVRAFGFDYHTIFKGLPPEPEFFDAVSPIDYEDVSHVVFQFTQFQRTRVKIPWNGSSVEVRLADCWDHKTPYHKIFIDMIERQGDNIGTFHEKIYQRDFNNVKTWLSGLEDRGIKTAVMTYPYEWIEKIKQDPWMNERFIEFNYKDQNYSCIEHLMDNNKELIIAHDYDNFEVPPQDSHPSLKCHRIMADHVINFFESK